VVRVDAALKRLHVIAVLDALGNVALFRANEIPLEVRQLGRNVERTHIRPHDAIPFAARIGAHTHLVLE